MGFFRCFSVVLSISFRSNTGPRLSLLVFSTVYKINRWGRKKKLKGLTWQHWSTVVLVNRTHCGPFEFSLVSTFIWSVCVSGWIWEGAAWDRLDIIRTKRSLTNQLGRVGGHYTIIPGINIYRAEIAIYAPVVAHHLFLLCFPASTVTWPIIPKSVVHM